MRRGRGRPKKYWGEVIRQDLAQLHLTEDMTLDRKEWRSCIKVVGCAAYSSIAIHCKYYNNNNIPSEIPLGRVWGG
ncbi:hypothetical protein H5410_028438 [Solanum commersonii]|uniref:Uncharacterized protein n=1 Tax=Solanum commersonii TaxID=4109 RepID=A0A9J5Z2Q2_SOLCO|nr:hypothetical protein H5410_028438 [Solanum commersonii]